MESNWTTPKVTKYDDPEKDWFVWFRYNGKLKTYKKGINYIKNLKQREKAATALRDSLHKRLKDGWNPLGNSLEVLKTNIKLIDAVKLGLERKKSVLAVRTFESYSTSAKYFIEAIKAMHLDYMMLDETKRSHVRIILEKTKDIRGWSNKAYNKNLGYLKAIFSSLIDIDLIEINPFHKIKSLKVAITEANRTPTDEEVKLIKQKLSSEFLGFWYFAETIFHTGIRPEELYQVKIKMIDLENDIIKLPPEITKTSRYRNIVIPKPLKEIFIKLNVDFLDENLYLFGSSRANKNRGVKPETDFIPGPIRQTRDCGSDIWNKKVKKELGLDVNMYSFKHLGGDKKILAGIDLDAIREQYGHTNKRMTLTYVRALKEINKKQIIDLSPEI